MTAVLSHQPSGGLLGRRRVSNSQYSPNMAPYMPTYNLSLKDPVAPHQHQIPMSTSHFIPIQTQPGSEMDAMMDINAFSQPNMAPNSMAFHSGSMVMNTTYTNPYNLASPFNTNMPAMSQVEQIPQWQTFDHMPMAPINTTHMRSQSQSSLESCPPLIKSEDELSPILPSQAFLNTPPYIMSEGSSSTGPDDTPITASSTDIDALMKAIQSKATNAAEQKNKVCLFSFGVTLHYG